MEAQARRHMQGCFEAYLGVNNPIPIKEQGFTILALCYLQASRNF